MNKIHAWLIIDDIGFIDSISSMFFEKKHQNFGWINITLGEFLPSSSKLPQLSAQHKPVIVCFELPADMKCVADNNREKIISLGDLSPTKSIGSEAFHRKVWAPCLPAVFAKEVWFVDEMSKREVESSLKRLLPGRGEWLSRRVIENTMELHPVSAAESEECLVIPEKISAQMLERLASATANAVTFGHYDLGKDCSVTFDTGTIALLRQIRTDARETPDQKLRQSDTKQLLENVFKAAKESGLKQGTMPRKINDQEIGALQVSELISELLQLENGVKQMDLIVTNRRSGQQLSPDQAVLGFVLKQLIEQRVFPTIRDIREMVGQISELIVKSSTGSKTDRETMVQALNFLKKNIENPEDRINNFHTQFGKFPGITGIAYVLWGWSESLHDNVESRLSSLSSFCKRSHQVAKIVFAAAVGAGGLNPKILDRQLWMPVYRLAWQTLLSTREMAGEGINTQELWHCETGSVKSNPYGLMVEIKLGGLISLVLKISDPIQVTQTLATATLQSEHSAKAARAILEAMDGNTSSLNGELKRLHQMSLAVRTRKDLTGEIQGYTLYFRNIKEADLKYEHEWSDPSEAARIMCQGAVLAKILNSIPEDRLEQLKKQLQSLPAHQLS